MQPQKTIEAKDVHKELETVLNKLGDLGSEFMTYDYQDEAAKRIAHHGICRRLDLLEYSSQQIFLAVSPIEELPFLSSQVKATAMFQAFIFNLSGVIDNLAWLWVLETKVRQENGHALNCMQIGFFPRKNYKKICKSLPKGLNYWLKQASPWFSYLSACRDSLAHRTPPYIVSTVLGESLGPCFTYNYPVDETLIDPSSIRVVRLHGQIVNDLMTLIELSGQILVALNAAGQEKLSAP